MMTDLSQSPDYWDREIAEVIAEVRPYTVVPDVALEAMIRLTVEAIVRDVPGDLVECGVWRGGACFAMLLAQQRFFSEIRRPVWMYDSFQGMGEINEEKDGSQAVWWKERSRTEPNDPDKQNYCTASIEEVAEGVKAFGLQHYVHLKKGWFADTLPDVAMKVDAGPAAIAILRIDCDWYDPCTLVYKHLAPLVSPGGVILIDDYHVWEGCRLATHEFIDGSEFSWEFHMIGGDGAWMRKFSAG